MERITDYRSQLMAFAMVAILFTHLGYRYDSYFANRLELLAMGGVDVFFFLSGYGLYFSSLKKRRALDFYKRRAIRILPPFFVILLIQLYVNNRLNLKEFLLEGSTLTFWIPGYGLHFFGWFVSAILLVYAIFPFFIRFFRKNPGRSVVVAIVIMGLIPTAIYAWYFNFVKPRSYNGLILAFARYPIFFLGVYYALWETSRKSFHSKYSLPIFIAVAIVALVGFNALIDAYGYLFMRNTGLLYLPFCLIVPGLLQMECKLLKFFPSILNRFLAFLGSATLESYLLIGPVYKYKWDFAKHLDLPLEYSNYAMMLTCILVGLIIHTVTSKSMTKLFHV